MAALPADRVYQGFWVDYTQGPVLGATITTTASKANIIIAVLSLLVAFSGAHLWDLIAFACYCAGISKHHRPVFHHQRQFLARNLTSPGSFVLEMFKLSWAWRRQRPSWTSRGLATMTLLALLCSVGFMAAGIFVSLVVSNVDIQVLVQSPSCGFLGWRNESTTLHRQYQQVALSQAMVYSEACYNKTGSLPQCNIYAQPNIPVQHISDVECPFPGLCKTPAALRLDTGLLDSDATFGINTRSDLRVQMQRVIICAPIDDSQFFTSRPIAPGERYNHRDSLPGEILYEWSMGPLTMGLRPYNSSFWMSNYTSQFTKIFDLTPRAYYAPVESPNDDFSAISPGWHKSTFAPIPTFQKASADTHILGVQNNGVRFRAPSEDPLFASHKQVYVLFDDNTNVTMYTGDRPATFLGCTEQFKFCFSTTHEHPTQPPKCTPLSGLNQAYHHAQSLSPTPTPTQLTTLRYLFLQTPPWYWITRTPMQVTKNSASFQLGVPPHQWRIEMFAWLSFLLAVTQSTLTHIAAGPGVVGGLDGVDALGDGGAVGGICHAQRMGAPDGYANVDFLGFVVMVAVSVVVMGVNLTLLPGLKVIQRRNPGWFPRVGVWVEDGMLQVQRRAYEGVGWKGWEGTEGGASVPVICGDGDVVVDIPALSACTGEEEEGGRVVEADWEGKGEGEGDGVTRLSVPYMEAVTRPSTAP